MHPSLLSFQSHVALSWITMCCSIINILNMGTRPAKQLLVYPASAHPQYGKKRDVWHLFYYGAESRGIVKGENRSEKWPGCISVFINCEI